MCRYWCFASIILISNYISYRTIENTFYIITFCCFLLNLYIRIVIMTYDCHTSKYTMVNIKLAIACMIASNSVFLRNVKYNVKHYFMFGARFTCTSHTNTVFTLYFLFPCSTLLHILSLALCVPSHNFNSLRYIVM